MRDVARRRPARRRAGGFTLMELLVVLAIVVLVSAVALPTVLPALANRQVSEGARILQGALAGARDEAIRNNAPRGIRLLPDPMFTGALGTALASNRIIAIEPAPDVKEGYVTFPDTSAAWVTSGGTVTAVSPRYPIPFQVGNPVLPAGTGNYPAVAPFTPISGSKVLMVIQAWFAGNVAPMPNPPTNWFWNVRIGDKLRFGNSGRAYTVVGPMTVPNGEMFVNNGLPGSAPPAGGSLLQETYLNPVAGTTVNVTPEFLFLVNGVDDDRDGYIDNSFNGVDENLTGVPDDIFEWSETEQWLGSQAALAQPANWGAAALPPVLEYVITRRPVPAQTAKEVMLPSAVVVDMTTWNTSQERSRVPVDPNTGYVDILLNQAGQVVPTTTYSSPNGTTMGASFYHFWIADRTDVYPPSGTAFSGGGLLLPQLPIPDVADAKAQVLKKERQLVTLFTRTGQVVTNSIENFNTANAYDTANNSYNANWPYYEAQLGIREAK